jgi:hypothetical protein
MEFLWRARDPVFFSGESLNDLFRALSHSTETIASSTSLSQILIDIFSP